MKKLQPISALKARDFARTSAILWQTATWDPRGKAPQPAVSVGGFPAPTYVEGVALVIEEDDSTRLPPSAAYMEDRGRNRYIDGCSASLLIMPPEKGKPCVNHLHIVPMTKQTEHHHPSDRIGLVVRGSGAAFYEGGELELSPGVAWRLPADLRHHFETREEGCDILVYHPDSAWGPTDETHQMLDATII